MHRRFRVKPFWFILILICFIVGILSLIPRGGGDGIILPYESIIPLAPVSTILIWLLGGFFFYMGRWFTDKPIRTPRQ